MTRLVVLAAIAAAAAVAAHAASSSPGGGVRLVEVGSPQFPHRSYILAMAKPRAITAADVTVTENGKPVADMTVTAANTVGRSSFGTVLLVDTSRSMRGAPIADAMRAARAFAARRNPSQQLAFVTFDRSVHLVLPFSSDSAQIAAALSRRPRLVEGTHMYDAVRSAVALLARGNIGVPTVVLLSDGADVGSTSTLARAQSALRASHARLFSVGLKSRAFDAQSLRGLAGASGGSYSLALSPSALPGIYDALGFRLANEYLVRYDSLLPPGAAVRVRVRIAGVGDGAAAYRIVARGAARPSAPPKPSLANRFLESWVSTALVILMVVYLLAFGIRRAFSTPPKSVPERLSEFVAVTVDDERRRRDAVRAALQEGQGQLFSRFAIWKTFVADAELADIRARPARLALWALGAGFVLTFVTVPVFGPAAILALLVPPFLLHMYVRRALRRRRAAFADQLADNLEVLASALRAGHSLVGALSVVVDDSDEPSKSELRRVLADEQLGVPLEDALRVTVGRMANRDLDQVAVVAVLQRDAGANSAEVLGQIVENIRGRQEIRRLITVLTAQGRMARWIVSALPVVLLLVISALDPGYMRPMWHEAIGHVFLVLSAILIAAGSFVIGRIVDIEV